MATATGTTFVGRLRAHAAGFPRPFWLLTAGWFIYVLGYECGYPFESIYLNEKLGISVTAIGLIYGLRSSAACRRRSPAAPWLDHLGRRPVMLLGIFATVVLFVGLAFARSIPLVVALIVFEAACGWGMFQMSSNAIVSDVLPEARRTEGYSITRTASSAGIVVGPLVGGLLLRHDPSYRWPFIVGGAFCAAHPRHRAAYGSPRRGRRWPLRTQSVRATFAGYFTVLATGACWSWPA